MKVIFIKDLKKQGKVNEVKEVSDGYAVNYLIKNGYAVKYTKTSSERLSTELENRELKEKEDVKNANVIKEKLEKEKLKFVVNSNNGRVFGSVSSKQIAQELGKLGYQIDKKCIKLDGSLSSLGVHQIKVELHKKVSAFVSVQLVEK